MYRLDEQYFLRSFTLLANKSTYKSCAGAIYEPGNCPKTNMASEYNFGMDGKAAQCVMRSGAKITLFPLDITHTIRFDINTLISRYTLYLLQMVYIQFVYLI